MSGIEIIFTLSLLALLCMWGWFILLAFRTSRLWGIGLIFLFPLSPFMFAYRFERKTRKIIYSFLMSFIIFAAVNTWIFFATLDFYGNLLHKISKSLPTIAFSNKPKVKKLNLPKPTPIPGPVTEEPAPVEEVKKIAPPPPRIAPIRRYKTIGIENAQSYLGKNVIVTTAFVVHKGRLTSVNANQIELKKNMEGGSTVMGVAKSKIQKFEVYL
jgi:hypothetical protein